MRMLRTRADAAHQEEKTSAWRDWCSYLQAHQSLLTLQSIQAHRTAFEREEAGEEAEAEAHASLHAIPVARRTLFDAVREQRRQEIQSERERDARMNGASHRMLDLDALDREALTVLLDEAEGRAREDGWGLVPLGSPDQPEWYCLDVAALTDAPQAALYLLGQTNALDRQKRLRLLAMLVGSAVVVLLIWAIWPKGITRRQSTGQMAAIVNGKAVEAHWIPQTLVVHSSSAVIATLPISATSTTAWATRLPTDSKNPSALWWQEQPFPLVLCMPSAVLREATAISIQSAGDAPERHYALRATAEGAGDLRLESCQSTGDPETIQVRYGALQRTETTPDALIGEEQELSNGTQLALRKLSLIGAGDDPTLPVGQVRVIADVVVRGATALDWPVLAPTLLLASGEEFLPGAMAPISDGMQLTYLIPTPLEAQMVVWQLTLPSKDRFLRWRDTLPLPPTRDAVLRANITIDQVTAVSEPNDSVQITVRVTNHGNALLTLTDSDLLLTHGESPIAGAVLEQSTTPIPPAATQNLSLRVPGSVLRQPLTLTMGAQQYRLSLP